MSDLPLRRYSNQAPETALNGSITASALTLDVDTASGFPDPPFTIEVEGEVMLVTDVAGLTFTVERAYDGSVPAAVHPDDAVVKHVLTADDFDHRWQDVIVTPNWDSTVDDEFDDQDASTLGQVSLGTTAWTEANGVLSCLYSGQTTSQVAARVQTLSTVGIGSGVQSAVRIMAATDSARAGVLFSSGGTTTDSVVWQYATLSPSAATLTLGLRSGTFNVASTQHISISMEPMVSGWIHMRLVWVSVNTFRAWWSPDGVSWSHFGQGNFTITGINPPTRMGVGVSAVNGSGDKMATFEYLRIWSP